MVESEPTSADSTSPELEMAAAATLRDRPTTPPASASSGVPVIAAGGTHSLALPSDSSSRRAFDSSFGCVVCRDQLRAVAPSSLASRHGMATRELW